MPAGATRAAAARVVSAVADHGTSLSAALPAQVARAPVAERALLSALSYGTLRRYHALSVILDGLLERPLRRRDAIVRALLLVGLHQLIDTRVPAHAAVAETVSAARAIDRAGHSKLVNAVLRRFQRERDRHMERVSGDETARHSHPAWLLDALRRAWPRDWEAVAAANNEQAPMWLRVNRRRIAREEYMALLEKAGLSAFAPPDLPDAVRLGQAVDVTRLPGFADGLVSVQDAGAQLAADLLDLAPGQRVLDACAAPGGKTCHVLERAGDLDGVVAIDESAARLERLTANLERLGLSCAIAAADACVPADWWDGRAFQRILLDVPCSATGVIRRHPDIKLLRRASDIAALAARQSALLDALWPLLAPGGRLVYASCSVLPEENLAQIAAFLARTPDASAGTGSRSWGRAHGDGRQLLPGDGGMDGFFYACLVKGAGAGQGTNPGVT